MLRDFFLEIWPELVPQAFLRGKGVAVSAQERGMGSENLAPCSGFKSARTEGIFGRGRKKESEGIMMAEGI